MNHSTSHNLNLDKPIFIVGSASSGTTLLSVILDRHLTLACGPELYAFDKHQIYRPYDSFLENLPDWLRYGMVSDGQVNTREFFFNRDAYFTDTDKIIQYAQRSHSLRDFFDYFFTDYLRRRNKQRWIEKTGSNAYCLDRILKMYPHAHIIHMVRDGRDVCSSLKKRNNTMFHAASHWLYNVSAAIRWRKDHRYFEVRYEDFVSDPEKTISKICNHIDVAFDPRMLQADKDSYWQKHSTNNIHQSWQTSPFDSDISTRSVGRYRNDMSPADIATFWHTALTYVGRRRLDVCYRGVAEVMVKLGYVDDTPRDIPSASVADYFEAMI